METPDEFTASHRSWSIDLGINGGRCCIKALQFNWCDTVGVRNKQQGGTTIKPIIDLPAGSQTKSLVAMAPPLLGRNQRLGSYEAGISNRYNLRRRIPLLIPQRTSCQSFKVETILKSRVNREVQARFREIGGAIPLRSYMCARLLLFHSVWYIHAFV